MKDSIENDKISVFYMFKNILSKVFKVSPFTFTLGYSLFLVSSLIFAANTMIMQHLFDMIVDYSTGSVSISLVVGMLMIFFSAKIIEEVVNASANFIAETYDVKVRGNLMYELNNVVGKLPAITFEDPNKLNDINKAYMGVGYAINFLNTLMDVFIYYLPYFIFIGWYLYTLKPLLLASLVVLFIPVMITQIFKTKVYSKLEENSSETRRKVEQYSSYIADRKYFKETRVLRVEPYFLKLVKDTLTSFNKLKFREDVKLSVLDIFLKLVSLMGYLGVLILLFISLKNGEISVGAFAAVFASIETVFNMMENMICNRLGYYAEHFGKVQNYLRIIRDNQSVKTNDYSETFETVTLKNVNFKYPHADKMALRNINIKIEKDETIAIVGENGSGKSTLAKIITGLYSPSSGKVVYNGNDVLVGSQIEGITSTFQDYQKYKLSLNENVRISSFNEADDISMKVSDILMDVGLNKDDVLFPNGLNTVLSRDFGGTELSGGIWQRTALARGLFRKHQLLMLDEPTAAIDPLEESNLYEIFREKSKDKTAIIITHRLGSIKFADRIIVMSKGKIIGDGSHKELLETVSLYNEMWYSQLLGYR